MISVLRKPTGANSEIISYVIMFEIPYVMTSEIALWRLLLEPQREIRKAHRCHLRYHFV